ncbi:MAG: hypothetical protein U1G07_06525 [Verrucomicrobiota bacterium]
MVTSNQGQTEAAPSPAPAGRRLAVDLLLFSLPLLLAWGGLEWFASRIPNVYSVKRKQLEGLSKQVDTLILGSSSGYYGIAPDQLSGSAYNLANFAQTLYYDDALAERVLNQLPKLRRVIVCVHYISLFCQLEEAAPERQYYYWHEWNLWPRRWRDNWDVRMGSAIALRSPEITVKELQTAAHRVARGGDWQRPYEDPEIDARGWGRSLEPAPPSPDLSEAAAKHALRIHHRLMHWRNEEPNLACFRRLLQRLSDRGIEPVLVVPPFWKTYIAEMDPAYWQETDTQLKSLARQYHARYLCYRDAPGFFPTDFVDLQHLSAPGAIRFSRLLNEALGSCPDRSPF